MDEQNNVLNNLMKDISHEVGATDETELDSISDIFDKTLSDALRTFNSEIFDDDGFIKRIEDVDFGDQRDNAAVKSLLGSIRSDYINADTLNQSELLLRRDIYNICTQMPEMNDVIKVIRDTIIECNVSTGEVSRSILFEDHKDDEKAEMYVKEIEKRHRLPMAIKNFIVPKGLLHGEMYINVVPYSKLFAELEALHDSRTTQGKVKGKRKFNESASIPEPGHVTLFNENNVSVLTEAAQVFEKSTNNKIPGSITEISKENIRSKVGSILSNIDVYNESSILFAENGEYGFKDVLLKEYAADRKSMGPQENHFMEAMNSNWGGMSSSMFNDVDPDDVDFKAYADVRGCYIKYLDGLKLVPIRIDRKIIGYYYISTTMDLQATSANPNGIIDLSYQTYTKDRNMVESISNMIIKSFNKPMLEKNIKLKNEIAEIVMAHKFAEGKLSFIYIPENEIIRIVINEDENGKGHSVLEPSMFPARMYLMLTLYNMLYTLNNTTTRVHYLKSSGLNKDYASLIQRTMRKFQSRRITIDDIFSYSGVLNKVGGMGEMVLPAGRGDFKAIETDTIPAVDRPFDNDFLDIQRRQALSGTGVPNLMVINAIDEVDFAKTLEMANTRFLSTVSAYKIDFNDGITRLYQKLLRYETDLSDDTIMSFKFAFNQIKQPDLVITAEMIQNFNTMVELVESIFYTKSDLEDDKGNPTKTRINLRKKLAKIYLPQLDFDKLDVIIDELAEEKPEEKLAADIKQANISNEDIKSVQETEE